MTTESVWKISQQWWGEVAQRCRRAVVFMDRAMAETLHWSGGMGLLLEAGARDVREFSSFESGKPDQPKAVFVVSSALCGVTSSVLCDIITASSFQFCTVATTVSPLLHSAADGGVNEGEGWEDMWCDRLLQWMGNMNYTSEVRHIPMFGVEVCPQLFITPAFSSLFPLLPSDVRQVAAQNVSNPQVARSLTSLADVELAHLPGALQAHIQGLSSGLHALLQSLDVREDIFCLGQTSRLVAQQLETYPPARQRRKTSQNRASLLLLDRSLDLYPSLTQQSDSLLDRLANTLDSLPGHSSDRLVDMTSLTHVTGLSPGVILPGSLAPPSHSHRPSHLTSLVLKKHKDSLMELNRKLVESASSEKLPLNLAGSRAGRVSADLIDSTLALFKGKYPAIRRHLGLLQVAMATSQSLRRNQANKRGAEAVTAAEKNVVQALCEGSEGEAGSGSAPSALALLSRLADREMGVEDQTLRELTLDDFVCLLTLTFSLSGGDCGDPEEASQLRDKLVEWIIQDRDDLPPYTKKIIGESVTESILHDQIESLWDTLEGIGAARDDLTHFNSVLDLGDEMTPASARPLLTQIMEGILDPARPDLPDIECKSGGLSNLLKSGFGFFKGSGKPRPGDAPLLILFVIGGVTSTEVRQVKDLVDKANPQFEVLIGSTRLSSIKSTLESVLVQDNVNVGTA